MDDIRVPVSETVLDAMRYIISCPMGKLLSFRIPAASARELADITEAFLAIQLERGFSALDYYKMMKAPEMG